MSTKPHPERPPVDLTWDNLVYTVMAHDSETNKTYPKQLLKGVSGTARRCRSLAVMGPSGAGKSTFLNAIAGRLQLDKQHTLSGTGYLNDVMFQGKYKPLVSYVAQDDIVMGKDTPREALTFSYRMRSGATAEEAEVVVNDMLEELKLTKCADTMLGIPGLLKGVSGGEKKRTNIGSELINNPMILLLDEPTTGLDSVNALRVGQLLKTLTREENRTVICTIHTPSSELYDVFDDILLLADGNVVYHGPADEAAAYFTSIGQAVPHHMNPSEYFMRLLQSKGEELDHLVTSWKKHVASPAGAANLSVNRAPAVVRLSDDLFDAVIKHRSVTAGTELGLLTGRSWRLVMRDPGATFGRLVQTLFFAVLLALMYANLTKDDDGVSDRAGVLFMQVMNLTFMQVMNALATFPPERAVFLLEQSNSLYSASLYYISKVVAEVPLNLFFPTLYVIITYFSWGLAPGATAFFNHLAVSLCIAYMGNSFGLFAAAWFPKMEVAMTLTPLFLMPMMLVGGLFANTERLEPYWVWLNYISFPRYAYKGFFVNEFDHIKDLCPTGNCRYTTGQEVKVFYGFDKETVDTVWFNCLLLIIMMLVFRVLGALGLEYQGRGQRSRLVFEENYRAGERPAATSAETTMAGSPNAAYPGGDMPTGASTEAGKHGAAVPADTVDMEAAPAVQQPHQPDDANADADAGVEMKEAKPQEAAPEAEATNEPVEA